MTGTSKGRFPVRAQRLLRSRGFDVDEDGIAGPKGHVIKADEWLAIDALERRGFTLIDDDDEDDEDEIFLCPRCQLAVYGHHGCVA